MLLYWILLPIVWVLAHIIWRFEVIGRENLKTVRDGRAYVIAPNHIANLDPVFIAITVFDWKRLRILAKEELFKNPLAGWFLRCMGAVSIERGKGDTGAVEHAQALVESGTILGIFPQGTCRRTRELGLPKSGAALIACRTQATVIPACLVTKHFHVRPFRRTTVVFGKPLTPQELQLENTAHPQLRPASRMLMGSIDALIGEQLGEKT